MKCDRCRGRLSSMIIPIVSGILLICCVQMSGSNHPSSNDFHGIEYPSFNTSVCLSEPVRVLMLECSSGQMIRLVRIFYGRSQQDRCIFSDYDCTMDSPNSENFPCIGKSKCLINLAPEIAGRIIPKCGQVSTYAQAVYQCIPESTSVNICEQRVVKGQQGYLQTSGYPTQNYPDNMDCNFTIIAPYENQRIGLYAIDFQLEANGTGCSDWMELFDGYKSTTLCGQRSRVLLLQSTHRMLHIRFFSSQARSQKGFWLYFHAFPFGAVTTTTLTTTVSTTTHQISTTTTTTSSVAYYLNNFTPASSNDDDDDDDEGILQASKHPNRDADADKQSDSQVVYVSENITHFPTALFLGVAVGLVVSALLVIAIILIFKTFLPARRQPSGEYITNIESKNNVEKEAMTQAGNKLLLQCSGDTKRMTTPQSAKRPLRNPCSQNCHNETTDNSFMNV